MIYIIVALLIIGGACFLAHINSCWTCRYDDPQTDAPRREK